MIYHASGAAAVGVTRILVRCEPLPVPVLCLSFLFRPSLSCPVPLRPVPSPLLCSYPRPCLCRLCYSLAKQKIQNVYLYYIIFCLFYDNKAKQNLHRPPPTHTLCFNLLC